jgi:hypothetical protein
VSVVKRRSVSWVAMGSGSCSPGRRSG